MPPQNWKCTHCLHPPTSNKIPYFCGNHWYCCRNCYEDELKNPHISHLLDPTHHQHDPNAKDKHPPKTKDYSAAHKHAEHHSKLHAQHALFDQMDREYGQVHHHDKSHHTHQSRNPVNDVTRYETSSFGKR